MSLERFEDLVKALTPYAKSARGMDLRAPALRSRSWHFIDKNIDADELLAFFRFPYETRHRIVGEARLGVHIFHRLVGDDRVLELAVDAELPSFVRREALSALALPRADVGRLVELIEKGEAGSIEVLGAALDLIAENGRSEFVPMLKKRAEQLQGDDYFVQELRRKLQLTCAALGDVDMIITVLTLRLSPWDTVEAAAVAAYRKLEEQLGGFYDVAHALLRLEGLPIPERAENYCLALQSHPEPCVRVWGIHEAIWSPAQEEACRNHLCATDWQVRNAAADSLIRNNANLEKLLEFVTDTDQNTEGRRWAALVYLKRGGNAGRLDGSLFAYPWRFEAPSNVRQAIVQAWGDGEPGSDVRYQIEKRLTDPIDYANAAIDRAEFQSALERSGYKVDFFQSAGDYHQQGSGTYWIMGLETAHVRFSTLGPFVSIDSLEQTGLVEAVTTIAASFGMTFVDEHLCRQIVPGLNVYFFGSREPLTVGDLLYYWQD